MSYIGELLAQRRLPELLKNEKGEAIDSADTFENRRAELKKLLQEKEYGKIPPRPDHMKVETVSTDESFCAGRAPLRKLKLIFEMGGEEFSFPAVSVIPEGKRSIPAFIHINFRPNIPDRYQPTEEIIDRGYAVFSFCYQDVATDDDNFKNGIAPYLCKNRRAMSAPGKIAMWAWAAMRMMDYVQSLDCIDKENVAVIGHSRLGKTALLTGGFDERFKYIISNDSGCCGAALSRGKIGETNEIITHVFPYWFCPSFNYCVTNAVPVELDQHYLLALSVPRHLIIGSAEEDLWADPKSEFLSLTAVNEAYALYGKNGLVHKDEIPEAKAILAEGDACYQVRHGRHYLSREDWNAYMDFIDKYVK